jgi:anti-sigma factor RsiW
MSEYITCKELIDFLWAYVAEELDAEQRDEFDRHLGVCPSCRAYLDSYRTTLEMEREVLHQEARRACEDAPEDLVQAILESRKKGS